MFTGLGLLVFLMLLGRRDDLAPTSALPMPMPMPMPWAPSAGLPPVPHAATQAASLPPAWPQAEPSGLPPFPSGWQPDEPPPPAVVARAYQLLDQLWAQGMGAQKVEQTAGRWITYRAEVVASGKKGIVAYRPKAGAAAAAAAPTGYHAPASAPTVFASTHTTPGAHPAATSHPGATAHASVPSSTPTLRQGSRDAPGVDGPVHRWQRIIGTAADGIFGPATTALTRTWQSRRPPLVADGVVGPATWAAALGGAPPTVQASSPPTIVVPSSATAPGTRTIRQGSRGDDVRWLQTQLRLATDGVFGPETKNGVVTFQRAQPRLTPDGVVGPQTWSALFRVFRGPNPMMS